MASISVLARARNGAHRSVAGARRTARFDLALLSGVAAAWLPAVAHAAPPEWLSLVSVQPTDPNRIVLAYENRYGGLLFSSDGGAHFDMRCMWSMEKLYSRWDNANEPLFAVGGDGTTLVPLATGLFVGNTDGCGFTVAAPLLPTSNVRALAVHPTDPNVTFLYAASGNPDNGSCARSGLMRRNADGTLTATGTPDVVTLVQSSCASDVYIGGIAAVSVPGAPAQVRIFEVGTRTLPNTADAAVPTSAAFVRFSDNDGVTFTEHALPKVVADLGVPGSILAVNPANPDQLILRYHRTGEADALFLSTDRGETTTPLLAGQITDVPSAAVAPDGRLWLGDRGDSTSSTSPAGLWSLASFTSVPTALSQAPVHCLQYHASNDTLYGCTMYGFGTYDAVSGAFSERFHIKNTRALVQCAGEDIAASCKEQLCGNGEAWCAPRHWAVAPVCDAYNAVAPCCGWPARDYDRRAEAGEPNPNGTCRAVPSYYADAGADGGSAGGGGLSDAGTAGDASSKHDSSTAGGSALPAAGKKNDGCSVTPHSRTETQGALLAFGVFSALFAFRRGRARGPRSQG